MGAIQYALQLYGPDFSRIHGLYLEHGYCYSQPDMLALARPCVMARHEDWVDKTDADAWWIHLVIGENALWSLYRHLPFVLPYIGWERTFKGKPQPRFYKFRKLKQAIKHHGLHR